MSSQETTPEATPKVTPEGTTEVTPENQAERIKWLRERGVEIELADSDPDKAKPAPKEGEGRPITLVRIPCNPKEQIEEVTLHVSEKWQDKDQLITLLAPRFVSTGSVSVDDSKLQESMKGLMASSSQTANLSVNKDKVLELLKGQGHAEAFSLSRGSEGNKFESIIFYLDEAGQLKQLPNNSRAVAIARYCGFENVPFVGDMYVARSRQDPRTGKVRAESFTLKEVDSSSPWMKVAERENYMRGVSEGRVTMDASNGQGDGACPQDPTKPYTWSQTPEEVEIVFNLPQGTSGKEVKRGMVIDIAHDALRVARKGAGGEVLLDISLAAKVRPDESTWTVAGDAIEFSLEKAVEEGWKKLSRS